MIPSLVARELREAIVEYLSTTFALTDDDTAAALTDFLLAHDDGIFRGPYLRIRLPFVDAPEGVPLPVQWSGPNQPFAHQLATWTRLAGRGRTPSPTLLTTGTGSGKTEGFLVPVVDHCVWARQQGQSGIKALVLYPMNALVADQERRLAKFLADPVVAAAEIRGGVWIGQDPTASKTRVQTPERLISDHDALRNDPPDILLTNYKMLDRLLTTPDRSRLWAANTPPDNELGDWEQPLRYVVLDEFHAYNGAQGTDVAMLLRRLGERMGIATPANALTGVAPVGTSATLGSAATATQAIVEFATRIFGVPFDLSSVVGEQRQTVAETIPSVDYTLPTPTPAQVDALTADDRNGLASAFTGVGFDNPVAVGSRMGSHHLTKALLSAASAHPRGWDEVVEDVASRDTAWGRGFGDDPAMVSSALAKLVALLSECKRTNRAGTIVPLFRIELQLWVREVARLLRRIDKVPDFQWADDPADPHTGAVLPSVFCNACGRSGWMGVAIKTRPGPLIETIGDEPLSVYAASAGGDDQRKRCRTMIRAGASEAGILWLDPAVGQVYGSDDASTRRIPILVGGMNSTAGDELSRDEAGERQVCPSCNTKDSIRFLGSRVTTLASVSITQMFGSHHIAPGERKLLAFTDSVQDASHRASFFGGRTHRFNLRALVARAIGQRGKLPLPELTDSVIAAALSAPDSKAALFALTPPDVVRESILRPLWEQDSAPQASLDAIRTRIAFEIAMEFGLRARLGRTIETTGSGAARVAISPSVWTALVDEASQVFAAHRAMLAFGAADVQHWVRGALERIRLRGGIGHGWYDDFLDKGGQRWQIWGGRPSLMPAFPTGISAPSFPASALPSDKSECDVIAGRQSWYGNWTERLLRISGTAADNAVRDLFGLLVHHGILTERASRRSTKVWALPPDKVVVHDIPDYGGEDGPTAPSELRCGECSTRHYVPPSDVAEWIGKPCLRYRCTGTYKPGVIRAGNYYRRLYRAGEIRRVVAAEHTGLLDDQERADIEAGFRRGTKPDDPNVLAATPTLEMGIDIGDLSAVMLTSVPRTQASYVQRAGRAGRLTGNSLVTTFAEAEPRSLYFLADPRLMITGEIPAPACYLDAREILHRQYLAYLFDRVAAQDVDPGAPMPRTISQLVGPAGRSPDGWLTRVLAYGAESEVIDRYISLFETELSAAVATDLHHWAMSSLAQHVNTVLDRWSDETRDFENRLTRIRSRETELQGITSRTDDEEADLGRIVSEAHAIARLLGDRRRAYTLNALEILGLLPNYTLFDDTVTINISLWHTEPDPPRARPKYVTEAYEKTRPAAMALHEFAPGNHFYVRNHRLTIDAVEVGARSEPLYRTWRLCPDCAFGTDDLTPIASCPRCSSIGIADQARTLNLLPIRAVSSTESEIQSRSGDDSDDRDIEWYETLATIDIDPADITASYLHSGSTVFGIEAARAATIRLLNLGRVGPHRVVISGDESNVSKFTVCRYCGGVFGVRGDRRDLDDKRHHRGFCYVRSGSRSPEWVDLALVHELRTEAVRILLPVDTFEAAERIASFQAALLIGLRESYGGDPEHLRIIRSSFPASGAGRNQFLVIHDTIPGGTGYLPRLADPLRLHSILIAARRVIATCTCQVSGQPGCHRCLYGHATRSTLGLIDRATALDVLDELLTNWRLTKSPNDTITGINLAPVRISELERKFKTVMRAWGALDHDVTVTSTPDPAGQGRTVFDVRFADGGPRWRLSEQKDLRVQHNTVPDFWFERVDMPGTGPVAVYLDGWEFHGARPTQVDADSMKRASLRNAGITVWNLTWDDVHDAHQHYTDPAKPLSVSRFLNPGQRQRAASILKHLAGAISTEAVDQHPIKDLFSYLKDPNPGKWRATAQAIAVGLTADAPTSSQVSTEDPVRLLEATVSGQPLPTGEGLCKATPWTTTTGDRGVTIVCPGNVIIAGFVYDTTTAVPDDEVDVAAIRKAWADWLHLSNALQHLDGATQITTTAGASVSPPVVVSVPLAAGIVDFSDCLDNKVADLARTAVRRGYPDVIFGLEPGDPDGTLIEAAWPGAKIGIVIETQPIGASLAADGWRILHVGDWSVESLVEALRGASA